MVVFVGDGSYLRSPSVVCVAEEGARGGASPDSGRMVSGVCGMQFPMKALGRAGKVAEGAVEGGAGGIVYIRLRAREGAWLYDREI